MCYSVEQIFWEEIDQEQEGGYVSRLMYSKFIGIQMLNRRSLCTG